MGHGVVGVAGVVEPGLPRGPAEELISGAPPRQAPENDLGCLAGEEAPGAAELGGVAEVARLGE